MSSPSVAFRTAAIAASTCDSSPTGDLLAVLVDRLLDLIRQRVGLVARVDEITSGLIFGRVTLCVLHHPVDFVFRQATRSADGDLLLLARRHVLGRDVDDAVGVDVERHFDLRHAARRRRQANQVEPSECPVVARQRPLALQHVDLDARLVVGRRRERFALARRNRRSSAR